MKRSLRVAFLGSAGIPNRYGGFESFLEHCGPVMAEEVDRVTVSCDARLYPDRAPVYRGVHRMFLRTPANGAWSVLHDLLAFLRALPGHDALVMLGVSGGLWFPLMRLLCAITGKRLIVNIDGIEWRRAKFSARRRRLLYVLDSLAQRFAHAVVYDNEGLRRFLLPGVEAKAQCIAYAGDHVLRRTDVSRQPGLALTICRIEPENNPDLLIEGFLASGFQRYVLIGNWQHSDYARALRARWQSEPRLELRDPIYDPQLLAELREQCTAYLHGHSVGGTNPSLVEMLFYDCRILALNVDFNRHTAGEAAEYFADREALAQLLDQSSARTPEPDARAEQRQRYQARGIASAYLKLCAGDRP